jgi:hypothetical protein
MRNGTGVKRTILILAAMATALVAASGVALALSCGGGTCEGNINDNKIHGTDSSDQIYGLIWLGWLRHHLRRGRCGLNVGRLAPGRRFGRARQRQDVRRRRSGSVTGRRAHRHALWRRRQRSHRGKGWGERRHELRSGDGRRSLLRQRGVDKVENCEVKNPPQM